MCDLFASLYALFSVVVWRETLLVSFTLGLLTEKILLLPKYTSVASTQTRVATRSYICSLLFFLSKHIVVQKANSLFVQSLPLLCMCMNRVLLSTCIYSIYENHCILHSKVGLAMTMPISLQLILRMRISNVQAEVQIFTYANNENILQRTQWKIMNFELADDIPI